MATALFAQDKVDRSSKAFSLCGSIAYGFGMGGQWIDASEKIDNQAILQEKSDKYLNYGDGFKLELGGIYKLMENLDAQAVLSYNAGVPTISAVYENAETNTSFSNTYKANTFGIKAMVLPRVKIFDLLDMYTGFGIGLYFASLSWTSSKTSIEGYFRTSPALAFCGTFGVNYPVYNDLIVYGEIALEQMSFTQTSSLDPSQINNFQKNYEQDSYVNNIYPPEKIPGSNVAFRVGAKFPIF
jgi:hypothetical protein